MYTYQGRRVFETVTEMVEPLHTVVMVHDMQNDNVGEEGSFWRSGLAIDVSRILEPLAQFVEKARGHGVRIWQTNYTNLPDFGSFNDPMVSKRWAQMNEPAQEEHLNGMVLGTWGCQTVDALKAHEGDMVVNKYRTNTFIHSNFELLLRSHGIKTIIHTGIATEVGILPTAWYAAQVGFFPIVLRDLVGPREPEYHEDAMKFLDRLVWVVDSSEVLEAWKSRP